MSLLPGSATMVRYIRRYIITEYVITRLYCVYIQVREVRSRGSDSELVSGTPPERTKFARTTERSPCEYNLYIKLHIEVSYAQLYEKD